MSADEQAMERVAEADREMARRKKPAVDVLRELMGLSLGLAAFFQPRPAGMEPNPHFNEQAFRYYAEFARDCAKALASYESPTLRSVAVAPAFRDRQLPTRITLAVFETDPYGRRRQVEPGGRRLIDPFTGEPEPPPIEAEGSEVEHPVAAAEPELPLPEPTIEPAAEQQNVVPMIPAEALARAATPRRRDWPDGAA